MILCIIPAWSKGISHFINSCQVRAHSSIHGSVQPLGLIEHMVVYYQSFWIELATTIHFWIELPFILDETSIEMEVELDWNEEMKKVDSKEKHC